MLVKIIQVSKKYCGVTTQSFRDVALNTNVLMKNELLLKEQKQNTQKKPLKNVCPTCSCCGGMNN